MVVDEVKTYRSNGTRIELDLTQEDEGVFLWNSENFHSVDEIEDLIKCLNSILCEIREVSKK